MNALSIIQMVLIVLATGGALLSNFTTVKKEGNITGWGKAFLVGVIFSLSMAVLLEKLKADGEEDKTNKEISKYQGIISRSDSSLKKADTTIQKLDSNLFAAASILKKTDSSLTRLSILQDSSNRIIHNLNKQLFLQKTVYDSTKKVLDRTSSILKSTQSIIDYTVRVTDPFNPIGLGIQFSDTITNGTKLKILEDSVISIVEKIKRGEIEDDSNVIIYKEYVVINNYSSVFKNMNFDFIHKTPVVISIWSDTARREQVLLLFSGVYGDGNKKVGNEIRSNKLKLTYYPKLKKFYFQWYLTKCDIEVGGEPKLIGVQDLYGKYLLIALCGMSNSATVHSFAFYNWNNEVKYLWIWDSNQDGRIGNAKACIHFQLIKPFGIWRQPDNYEYFFRK